MLDALVFDLEKAGGEGQPAASLCTSTCASTQSPIFAEPAKSVVTLAVVGNGDGVRLRVA